MLNQCTFEGRLTRTPELRRSPAGKSVTSFSIAVDRNRPDRDGNWISDFIDCVAWDRTAEKFCEKYKKGDTVIVSGRMQQRSINSNDGQKRKIHELVITECYKFNSRKNTVAESEADAAPETDNSTSNEDFAIIAEPDGQLPF